MNWFWVDPEGQIPYIRWEAQRRSWTQIRTLRPIATLVMDEFVS
jgi:hypothetical protein